MLGYILLSVSAWTASVQINEQHLGERFALKNAKNVLDQLSDREVGRIVHIIAYNSLYQLNHHATVEDLNSDLPKDGSDGLGEFYYVNKDRKSVV